MYVYKDGKKYKVQYMGKSKGKNKKCGYNFAKGVVDTCYKRKKRTPYKSGKSLFEGTKANAAKGFDAIKKYGY